MNKKINVHHKSVAPLRSRHLFSLGLILALLLVFNLAFAKPVLAAVIVVNTSNDELNSDGDCSLREAIQAANTNTVVDACLGGVGLDTITFDAGLNGTPIILTLTGADEDANVTGDLDIISDLTIMGNGASVTVIDGNSTDRVFHILIGTVVFEDITIQNGIASDGADGLECNYNGCYEYAEDGQPGGGIYNQGTLTIQGVAVTANQSGNGGNAGDINCSGPDADCSTSAGAGGYGGGIYNEGTLTIQGVAVTANRSGNGGNAGDVNCPDADVNCIISASIGGHGGGIYNGGVLTINASTITNNQVGNGGTAGSISCNGGGFPYCSSDPADPGNGGGVAGGTITILNSTFADNFAYDGGAIQQGNVISIATTLFSNNTATWSGGAINCNSGSMSCTIATSTFTGNSVLGGFGGGAIAFFNNGFKSVTNSTISGNNSRRDGGGITSFNGPLELAFVTISNNIADSDNNGSGNGGGIHRVSGSANIQNSIIADNVDMGGQAPDCTGTWVSQTYNHIETLAGCTFTPSTGDVIGSDPGLVSLADNGGPTQTQDLSAGSVAIDAIPDGTSDCGTTHTIDQRGAGRSYNGACDKGAYEVREAILVGSCGGTALNGLQAFNFVASSNSVTIDVDSGDGINCLTVEEMGPNATHLVTTGLGAGGSFANNWWHITGNVTSGFNVIVTLPYSSANVNSRACRWLGNYYWDCDDDGINTSFVAGTSVTRSNVTSFSDWAVANNTAPTAVSLRTITASSINQNILIVLAMILMGMGTAVFLISRRV